MRPVDGAVAGVHSAWSLPLRYVQCSGWLVAGGLSAIAMITIESTDFRSGGETLKVAATQTQ